MQFTIALIIGLAVVIILLLPFFVGKGGALEASTSVNSPEKLEAIKRAVLRRYLEDEAEFEQKRMSRLVWHQRRSFLTSRYIDAARRLDYLRGLSRLQAKEGANGSGLKEARGHDS